MKKLILLLFAALILAGCSESTGTKVEVNQVLDVSQFSRITPEELTKKLGDPKKVTDNKWTNPGTGQEYNMKTYDYNIEGYDTEFLVIENAVVRMNVYPADNPGNKFIINQPKDVLALSGITPRDSLIEIEENDMAARYSSVSDTVGEVWAILDEKAVSILKVTYNLNYFN